MAHERLKEGPAGSVRKVGAKMVEAQGGTKAK